MAQTSFPLEVGGFHPSPRPDFWPVPSARAPHGPAIPVPSIPQTCPFPSSGRPGSPALPPLAEYQPLPTPYSTKTLWPQDGARTSTMTSAPA